MKTLFSLFVSLIIVVCGCSADLTENPAVPEDDPKNTNLILSKQSNLKEITEDQIPKEALEYIALKRKELGIKVNPDLKPFKSERIDISKMPGIILPTLAEIEKLSPGNSKYFSGYNLTQTDNFTLNYYSWCVPQPTIQKPIFEYMGSGQSSSIPMDLMQVWSYHYLNWGFQDGWTAWNYYTSSLSVNCNHNNPYGYYNWDVNGRHYFFNDFNPPKPFVQYFDYSYANDEGVLQP